MPDEFSTTSVTWQPPEGGSVTVIVRDSSNKMPTEADYPVLRESTALAMAEAIARMAALLDGGEN